jgi:hydroxyacylglutathione hydrolase
VELIKHQIFTVRNKTFPSNTYLLKNKLNNSCLIIDPGLDAILINEEIIKQHLQPVAVISTHGHFDHIGSASFFIQNYNLPFYLHEADLKISKAANFFLKMGKYDFKIETPTPSFLFKNHYENIHINNFIIDVYHFPGHSPGSCVFKIDNYLFSGDIIYKNGLGAGSFPKDDKMLLKQSILKIFDIFDKENLVLPGHGDSEFLEVIKKKNFDLQNFLMQNYEG